MKELSGSLVFLVINKVDQVPREELLPVIKRYNGFRQFDEVFPISALTGENVEQLLNTLEHLLPIGDPFFPTDKITNQAEEEMAGDGRRCEARRCEVKHGRGKAVLVRTHAAAEQSESRVGAE